MTRKKQTIEINNGEKNVLHQQIVIIGLAIQIFVQVLMNVNTISL